MSARPTDRILKLLDYAGPGGVSGHDIGAICNIGTAQLYPLLAQMEAEHALASEFRDGEIGKPRRRYSRLACYAQAVT